MLAASSASSALVCSSVLPSGISTMTCTSDLLSSGSIFSTTSLNTASDAASSTKPAMPANNRPRFLPLASPRRNGDITRSNKRCSQPACFASAACEASPCPCRRSNFNDSHGVTIKAIASDSNMPTEALIGIGRIYGPIKPDTKAIGISAAITVNVARMVGPPTSSTAGGMASRSDLPSRAICRWMFSTTTMASSTKIPIEKISANSDTRLRVKPIIFDANRVTANVSTTAVPTTIASRQPSANNTNSTTLAVAKINF